MRLFCSWLKLSSCLNSSRKSAELHNGGDYIYLPRPMRSSRPYAIRTLRIPSCVFSSSINGFPFRSLTFPCHFLMRSSTNLLLYTQPSVSPHGFPEIALSIMSLAGIQYMYFLVRHALRTFGRCSMRLPMSFPMGSWRVPCKFFDNLLWVAPYVSCMHVRLYALPVYPAFYYTRQREFFLSSAFLAYSIWILAHCSCVYHVVSVMLSSKHWAV